VFIDSSVAAATASKVLLLLQHRWRYRHSRLMLLKMKIDTGMLSMITLCLFGASLFGKCPTASGDGALTKLTCLKKSNSNEIIFEMEAYVTAKDLGTVFQLNTTVEIAYVRYSIAVIG